jgi:hypothetical protein
MPKTSTNAATGWNDLGREVDRCRRSGMSFALLRFSAADERLTRRHFTHRHNDRRTHAATVQSCVDLLRSAVRSVDHVWMDGTHTYVVLCDTEVRGIKAFLARLSVSAPEIVERSEPASCVFPDDGMTSAALVAALDASQRPDPATF